MRRILWHECGTYRGRIIDPFFSNLVASDVHLKTAENDSGQLDFTLPPTNPETAKICPMVSEIVVCEDDSELFRGRVTSVSSDAYGLVQVTAKGVLDYLHDAILKPATYTGTAREVLNDILYDHNNRPIEAKKQFLAGDATVTGDIKLEIKNPLSTWDAIKKLIADYGGYVFARKTDSGFVIDWLADLASVGSQRIEFGKNMLDLKDEICPDSLCTVLYGYGKDNLTFVDQNGGNPYILDAEAVEAFGWIEGVYSNSSCDSASVLLHETQAELADRLGTTRSISIKAVDLADLYDSTERLQVGSMLPCRLPGAEKDETLRLKELDWYIFEPKKTTFSVGANLRTISRMIGR